MDTSKLRKLLCKCFDKSDLKNICQDLDIDYEDLPGDTKSAKCRELINYCNRRTCLLELLTRCRDKCPNDTESWIEFIEAYLSELDRNKLQKLCLTLINDLQKMEEKVTVYLPLSEEKVRASPPLSFVVIGITFIGIFLLSGSVIWAYMYQAAINIDRISNPAIFIRLILFPTIWISLAVIIWGGFWLLPNRLKTWFNNRIKKE